MAGTRFEAETAARFFFAAKHSKPELQSRVPSPAPEELLLRPFSVKADSDSFVDALDDGQTPLILTQHRRVLVPGARNIVHSKSAYKHQLKLFTRGSLNGMDWSGVLLAGGACLAPLLRLPPELGAGYLDAPALADEIFDDRLRWRTIRHYNGGSIEPSQDEEVADGDPFFYPDDDRSRTEAEPRSVFAGGDIDLFLYGLSVEDAFAKVRHIAEVLNANGEVNRILRTHNAITFFRGWPLRHVQIILRMYDSPADALASFDIDCCACGFDGSDVLVLRRARLAINRALNVVDPSRESPTYDTRLWKYSQRGFGVAIPAFTGIVQLSELAKPRSEMSGLARLVKFDQQVELLPGSTHHAFFSSKGIRVEATTDSDVGTLDQFLNTLASRSDLVVGDAYGDRVLFPYWPHQFWADDWEKTFERLLGRLLLVSFADFQTFLQLKRRQPLPRKAQLREPSPVLPWLFSFSKDISFVLDARDQPRVAFSYTWEEDDPLGVKITHTEAVPYETSVPLLCTFAAPSSPTLLSGSFFASSPGASDVRAFYRGMAPSAVMQRHKPRAPDT